jgi:hypothetical protein
MIRRKNFCKCHNVPTPSTTIKKKIDSPLFIVSTSAVATPPTHTAQYLRDDKNEGQNWYVTCPKGTQLTNNQLINHICAPYLVWYITFHWKNETR